MKYYCIYSHRFMNSLFYFFFFQAEDGIRDLTVTGVQTCALPISCRGREAVQREYEKGIMHVARPVQQRQGLISRSNRGGYQRERGALNVFLTASSHEIVSQSPLLVLIPPIRLDDRPILHPPAEQNRTSQ